MTNRLGRKFKLGLLINPFAGIGGALAFKGSDGDEIRQKALAMGAPQLAMEKAEIALQQIVHNKDNIEIYTGSGDMGASIAKKLSLNYFEVHKIGANTNAKTELYAEDQYQQSPLSAQTNEISEISDTITLVRKLNLLDIDLLLFAGGDGTARNVCSAINKHIPVLGVPAGCKIHSGVYAITPRAAGLVMNQVINGELVSLQHAEVRDIDETRFREGQVVAKHYGEMQVPEELSYIQAVKMGGKESDELLLDDISDYIIEIMEEFPETCFVMGSGSTVDAIMNKADIQNTLLGVDIVCNMQLLASDVNATELLELTKNKPTKLVLTIIGGQGHILGRGNQQLSPQFIKCIGKTNILLVATKSKLQALNNKGLISDSGDPQLDNELAGPVTVITGYKDQVLYFIRG